MLNILFSDRDFRWAQWQGPLRDAFADAGIPVHLHRDTSSPQDVDYVVYSAASPLQDFTPYTRLKAVLSMWAGVDSIVGNKTLTVPLTRMSDQGLQEGMVEYVTGHVLRHHLGMDAHIHGQDGVWRDTVAPPLARERSVGILGLGALGRECARSLSGIGFNVHGWSRQEKQSDHAVSHFGPDGLRNVLDLSDYLVLLLPHTAETENILNDKTLAGTKPGVVIINAGRGPLIDEAALIAALDRGQVSHATLDVFWREPLPPAHALWAHPKVTVTPHIAAETRARSSATIIAENVRRSEAGEPLLYLVDREQGY